MHSLAHVLRGTLNIEMVSRPYASGKANLTTYPKPSILNAHYMKRGPTMGSGSTNVRRPKARAASQRMKLRQWASFQVRCRTCSSGHELGSRQTSLKRLFTSGT